MNTKTDRIAARNRTLRNALPFEQLEARQLMAATAVKSVDSNGPDYAMVEAKGHTYVLTSSASGAGSNQIYVTDGAKSTSKLLVDCTKNTSLSSLDDLTTTSDGRVLFTANAATGGRQVFEITSKGFTQITKKTGAFFGQIQAVGTKVFLFDSTNQEIDTLDSKNAVKKVVGGVNVYKMFAAKGQLFYTLSGDGGVYRSDGTSAGTYKISGSLSVGANDIFGSNDWIYFEGSANNNTSLYRSDGSKSAPVKIADDFSIASTSAVELGDAIYFGGAYYNTSPNAKGSQLYRVNTATGVIDAVTTQVQTNGGAAVDNLGGIGTNIYFVSNDGDFLPTEGTYDRELFRYSTVTGQTTQVTDDETLYPVGIGGGVLSSYYFVAAPEKEGSRFGGIRNLYRTSPANDQIEKVSGVPTYDTGTKDSTDVQLVFAGSKGLFFSAKNNDGAGQGRDTDTYFVPTPFSFIDPVTKKLTIEATAGSDTLQLKVVGSNLTMTLNGITETQPLANFNVIDIYLKDGNDKLTTASNVTKNINAFGDAGDDYLQTGSGNDYVLTGAGKNTVYGGAGEDKLKGAGGQDKMYGEDGADTMWGRGGSDILDGGAEIDVLRGDDSSGAQGNDTLRGGSSNDRMYGGGGDDRLEGGKQNDSMVGGAGNDTLIGNEGNDQLFGDADLDELYGNDGDDNIEAVDNALDLIDGGAGNDTALADTKEKKLFSIETIV